MKAVQYVFACFVAAAITLGAIYVVGRSGEAEAHYAADTNITGIVKRGDLFSPYGPHDQSPITDSKYFCRLHATPTRETKVSVETRDTKRT
jgi:hypothetical protein